MSLRSLLRMVFDEPPAPFIGTRERDGNGRPTSFRVVGVQYPKDAFAIIRILVGEEPELTAEHDEQYTFIVNVKYDN